MKKRKVTSALVLRNAISSLAEHPRYADIIDSYFMKLDRNSDDPLANKYSSVLASINRLWLDSEKNPSIFSQTKDFEPILQKNKYYRDHFIHSFNVFLLGYYIINKMREVFPNKHYFGNNEDHINLTWMLTSTFHDVAYPVQETESWLNGLFEKFLGVKPNFSINIGQILPIIYIDFMRLLSKYHSRTTQGVLENEFLATDWRFYNELGSELTKKNHGVIGALMLCHRMAIREGFLKQHPDRDDERNPWNFLRDHMPACHAISVHDMESIRVLFKKFPFAYLLILCDELQDWGRPSKRANVHTIKFRKINICGEDIPEIKVGIICSTERKDRLKEVIRKRLNNGKEIKLTIE